MTAKELNKYLQGLNGQDAQIIVKIVKHKAVEVLTHVTSQLEDPNIVDFDSCVDELQDLRNLIKEKL